MKVEFKETERNVYSVTTITKQSEDGKWVMSIRKPNDGAESIFLYNTDTNLSFGVSSEGTAIDDYASQLRHHACELIDKADRFAE